MSIYCKIQAFGWHLLNICHFFCKNFTFGKNAGREDAGTSDFTRVAD